MLVLCIAKCIARAHVDQHVDWLLDVMHIYMRVCSCFTAMLTVSDSVVSFLGAGCWVLGIGCIEYTYRTQTNSYERCSRAFHSVIPLKQCHVLRAYAHWLYQQRQPAPCRPVVSARRSKPPGSPWFLIPSCPAGATGPGLECRASIKHGPGMRI